MAIKGLTDRPRPPRLGKIRLGVKTEASYPQSKDYFVCPPEVKAVFGDEPTELTVFFPSNTREEVFLDPMCC